VDEIAEEIGDRFGPPPQSVEHLLQLTRLRLRCRALGIARLTAGRKAVAATFRDAAGSARLVRLLTANVGGLRWSDPRLILERQGASVDERLAAASTLLDRVEASAGKRRCR
jgi:transcription-repair coupling factor (superfamily II helicase)